MTGLLWIGLYKTQGTSAELRYHLLVTKVPAPVKQLYVVSSPPRRDAELGNRAVVLQRNRRQAVSVEWVAILLRVPENSRSNLGLETVYPD